ncbi:MAG: hypothetical protein ACJAS1_000813 [Oleiphilaceae bacterium]|jgi:hypothetical protein
MLNKTLVALALAGSLLGTGAIASSDISGTWKTSLPNETIVFQHGLTTYSFTSTKFDHANKTYSVSTAYAPDMITASDVEHVDIELDGTYTFNLIKSDSKSAIVSNSADRFLLQNVSANYAPAIPNGYTEVNEILGGSLPKAELAELEQLFVYAVNPNF